MTDLLLTINEHEIQYLVCSPEDDDPTLRPWQLSAKDFGYEIDEQELAEELITPVPIGFAKHNPAEVDAQEFESVYKFFLA